MIRDLLGVLAGCDPSGDTRDHRAGARLTAADTFAALYRLQALRRDRRARLRRSSTRWCCRRRRPPIPPRRCWPIRSSSTAGSAPTPISSTCSTSAAWRCRRRDARGRHPVRHHAAGARRPRRAARQHRPRLPRRHQTADRAPEALPQPPLAPLPAAASGDEITIAVVGAHLSGMALNGELQALGGRLLEETTHRAGLQALCARHHAAEARHAARRAGRGIVRSSSSSGRCRRQSFGKFVAAIPPPLSIGTVRLADGREREGLRRRAGGDRRRARHFAFGGWRAFMAENGGARAWMGRRRETITLAEPAGWRGRWISGAASGLR